MFYFSKSSEEKLMTCHNDLQIIMRTIIQSYDIKIIWGTRGEEKQNELFDLRLTTKRFPHSKHNITPSNAIDIAPYPIDWDDIESFYYLAGRVMQTAELLGIKLIFGGDWDRDNDLHDQTLFDLGHYERVI